MDERFLPHRESSDDLIVFSAELDKRASRQRKEKFFATDFGAEDKAWKWHTNQGLDHSALRGRVHPVGERKAIVACWELASDYASSFSAVGDSHRLLLSRASLWNSRPLPRWDISRRLAEQFFQAAVGWRAISAMAGGREQRPWIPHFFLPPSGARLCCQHLQANSCESGSGRMVTSWI